MGKQTNTHKRLPRRHASQYEDGDILWMESRIIPAKYVVPPKQGPEEDEVKSESGDEFEFMDTDPSNINTPSQPDAPYALACWTCQSCQFDNFNQPNVCLVCYSSRPAPVAADDRVEESEEEGELEVVDEEELANSSFTQNLGSELVHFRFGNRLLPSPIHQKAILSRIPGFIVELQNLEPGSNKVRLPEHLLKPIELLIEWCYKEKLAAITATTSPDECWQRIKLYCLAEKYQQVQLMNEIVDSLLRYMRNNLPWDIEWCSYAYQNTSDGSPVRRLMAKWLASTITDRSNNRGWNTRALFNAAQQHQDLAFDVFQQLRGAAKDIRNPKNDASTMYRVQLGIQAPSPRAPNRKSLIPSTQYYRRSNSEQSEFSGFGGDGSINHDNSPSPLMRSSRDRKSVKGFKVNKRQGFRRQSHGFRG